MKFVKNIMNSLCCFEQFHKQDAPRTVAIEDH